MCYLPLIGHVLHNGGPAPFKSFKALCIAEPGWNEKSAV